MGHQRQLYPVYVSSSPERAFLNGDPITAEDFVWSLRRGWIQSSRPSTPTLPIRLLNAEGTTPAVRSSNTVHRRIRSSIPQHHAPVCWPRIKTGTGKEFVPIRAEDVALKHWIPLTLRYSSRSLPYFLGMMAHQFFMVVHRKTIEKYGNSNWILPQNIVTSGPFHLTEWVPYDRIVARKDPMYWDAENMRLEEIRFYPAEDTTTMMNLYKAGAVDALENHSVPLPWNDFIRPLKDYMDAPEEGNYYLQINTTRPPMNDVRVRKAFSLSLDRDAIAKFRRVAKPLSAFIPPGIYPGYPAVKGDSFDPKRARQLLAEAGYRDAAGNFDPSKFPIDKVEYTYNTADPNRQIAELLQSQWKQNLGLTGTPEGYGDPNLFSRRAISWSTREFHGPDGSVTTWIPIPF
jgi:oligopeptide transport system substrate-binding protein